MQPSQNSSSSIQKSAQIDSTQHCPTPSSRQLRMARVANTIQQPAVNFSQSFEASIEIKNQTEVLNSLFNIMLGHEKFVHFEEKATSIGSSGHTEKFYYLELISAALHAKSSLFEMKMIVAKLIDLETSGAEEVFLREKQSAILRPMLLFVEQTVDYHKLLTILQSDQKHEFPLEQTNYKKARHQKAYAPKKKVRAEITLASKKANYEALICEKKISPEQINNRIYNFLKLQENWFIGAIKKRLKSFSPEKIDEAIKSIKLHPAPPAQLLPQDDEMPSTSSAARTPSSTMKTSILDSILSIPSLIESQTEFKIDRIPVDEDFWNEFYSEAELQPYKTKFYQFMLTSWNSDYYQHRRLKLNLSQAKKKEDKREFYQLSIKKYFQLTLKDKACLLISEILKAKDLCLAAKNSASSNPFDNFPSINMITKSINQIAETGFKENRLYQIKSNLTQKEMVTSDQLHGIKRKIENVGRHIRKKEKYVLDNIVSNINYINEVLKILKKQHYLEPKEILLLAGGDSEKYQQFVERAFLTSNIRTKEEPQISLPLASSQIQKQQDESEPLLKKSRLSQSSEQDTSSSNRPSSPIKQNIIFASSSTDNTQSLKGQETNRAGDLSIQHEEELQYVSLHFAPEGSTEPFHQPSTLMLTTSQPEPENIASELLDDEAFKNRMLEENETDLSLNQFNLNHHFNFSEDLDPLHSIKLNNLHTTNLNTIAVNDISDTDENDLNAIDLNNLHVIDLNYLNDNGVSELNVTDLSDLNAINLNVIDTNDLNTVDISDLSAFNISDSNAFDTSNLNAFNISDSNAFDTSDLNAVDISDLNAVDISDLNAIDADDLNAIDASDFDAIDLSAIDVDAIDLNDIDLSVLDNIDINDLNDIDTNDLNDVNAFRSF